MEKKGGIYEATDIPAAREGDLEIMRHLNDLPPSAQVIVGILAKQIRELKAKTEYLEMELRNLKEKQQKDLF